MTRQARLWALLSLPPFVVVSACASIVGDFEFQGSGGAASSTTSDGSAGITSSSGSGTAVGQPGEPCAQIDSYGCRGNASHYKVKCGLNHTWVAEGTCDGTTLCDTTVNPGTCQAEVPGCIAKSPGDILCVGEGSAKRVKCGPDLVTIEDVDTCPYLCSAGRCTGECVPTTDTRCFRDQPQRCDAMGAWQDDGAASPGSCTAAVDITPPSCVGLPSTCGPAGDESCCASPTVVGGAYSRDNDDAFPAKVSDFRLDRFEITVGRFRAFVKAYDASPGSKPLAGAGASPMLANSGWDATWNLAATSSALTAAVKCDATDWTWTDMAGGAENMPMNCLDWYEAFAFCAWDGGRLPTEAEWNYAAAGGNEQRQYPWSTPSSVTTIDSTYAVYDGASIAAAVGAKSPKGDGRWGQADLAGGVWEWNLDSYADSYAVPCLDCANLSSVTYRVVRGGSNNNVASALLSSVRNFNAPVSRYVSLGARCARTP